MKKEDLVKLISKARLKCIGESPKINDDVLHHDNNDNASNNTNSNSESLLLGSRRPTTNTPTTLLELSNNLSNVLRIESHSSAVTEKKTNDEEQFPSSESNSKVKYGKCNYMIIYFTYSNILI